MSPLQRLWHNCKFEVSPGYTARPCLKKEHLWSEQREMKPRWDATLAAAVHVDMGQPVVCLLPMARCLVAAIFLLFCSAVWVGIHKCSKNKPSVRAGEDRERGEDLPFKSALLLEQDHRWEASWFGRYTDEDLF